MIANWATVANIIVRINLTVTGSNTQLILNNFLIPTATDVIQVQWSMMIVNIKPVSHLPTYKPSHLESVVQNDTRNAWLLLGAVTKLQNYILQKTVTFCISKNFLEKPRPYTFQMGSRLSLEIKNFISSVLDHCENFFGKCVRFPNISVPIYIYSDVLLSWNLE